MSSLFRITAFAIFFLALGQAFAGEPGDACRAVALVHKAVADLGQCGREKTITQANNAMGRFVNRHLYAVIHDMNGKTHANPAPRMLGKGASALKDADEKPFIKDRFGMLKTWIDFKWPNSVTQQIENGSLTLSARMTWFSLVGF